MVINMTEAKFQYILLVGSFFGIALALAMSQLNSSAGGGGGGLI